MSQGEDLLFYLSSDGTSGGTETAVELQGNLTINPGHSISNTVYKNGEEGTVNRAGWGATFEMGNSAPLATGEALVWAAHDSRAITYFWIRNATTGGIEFAGQCRVAINSFGSPSTGPNNVSVAIGAVGGEPTRSAAV